MSRSETSIVYDVCIRCGRKMLGKAFHSLGNLYPLCRQCYMELDEERKRRLRWRGR